LKYNLMLATPTQSMMRFCHFIANFAIGMY
jgi:hypothetical protein